MHVLKVGCTKRQANSKKRKWQENDAHNQFQCLRTCTLHPLSTLKVGNTETEIVGRRGKQSISISLSTDPGLRVR